MHSHLFQVRGDEGLADIRFESNILSIATSVATPKSLIGRTVMGQSVSGDIISGRTVICDSLLARGLTTSNLTVENLHVKGSISSLAGLIGGFSASSPAWVSQVSLQGTTLAFRQSLVAPVVSANAILTKTLAASAVMATTATANTLMARVVYSDSFFGNGSNLTGINSSSLTGNLDIADSVTSPLITGTHLVSGDTVAGRVVMADSLLANTITSATIYSNSFVGNAHLLHNLRGEQIVGIVKNENLPPNISSNSITSPTINGYYLAANTILSNTINSNSFVGNGHFLYGLRGDEIVGLLKNDNLPSNIVVRESLTSPNIYGQHIYGQHIYGQHLEGNARGLFGVVAANIVGTLPYEIFPTTIGTPATFFVGDGSGLTNLTLASVIGNASSTFVGNNALFNRVEANSIYANETVYSNAYLSRTLIQTGMYPENEIHFDIAGDECVRITPIGLGIKLAQPEHALHVQGNIFASGEVIALSDKRSKSNLEVIPQALEKVCQLTGYTFDRGGASGRRFTGLLAQDVVGVLDEAVHETQDGMLALAYPSFAGLFVEAFKILAQRMTELEIICGSQVR